MTLPIPKKAPAIKVPGLVYVNGAFRGVAEDYRDPRPVLGIRIFEAIVLGELASKSNQRKLVMFGKGPNARPAIIKSQKARDYVQGFLLQTAGLSKPSWLMSGEMTLEANIFYASQRPDLDCALLQDCIQEAGIVTNDRQFRELHIFHFIDKLNPRVEFKVYPRKPSFK